MVTAQAQLICHPVEFVLNSCPDSTHEPTINSKKPFDFFKASSHTLTDPCQYPTEFPYPVFISVWPRRNLPANIQLAEHPIMQHLSDIAIFGSVFGWLRASKKRFVCFLCFFPRRKFRETWNPFPQNLFYKWPVVCSKSSQIRQLGVIYSVGWDESQWNIHTYDVYPLDSLDNNSWFGKNARFGGGHQGPHSPVNHDCSWWFKEQLFSRTTACTCKHVTCSLGGLLFFFLQQAYTFQGQTGLASNKLSKLIAAGCGNLPSLALVCTSA